MKKVYVVNVSSTFWLLMALTSAFALAGPCRLPAPDIV